MIAADPNDTPLDLDGHLERFGYSFEIQFEEAATWEAERGMTLERISDWNVPPGCVDVPHVLIEEAFQQSLLGTTNYAETAQLISCADAIRTSLVGAYGIELPASRQVHVFGNATQAITGVIYALREQLGHPRLLLVHPSYYCVQDAARLCGVETWGVFRRADQGFALDFERLAKLVRSKQVNVLCITDPVYSVGLALSEPEWSELVGFCDREGLWLVLDNAFGGLSWRDRESAWIQPARLSTTYEKLVLIDAPSKRLFVNNVKFGLVFAHAGIVQRLQEFTDWHLGNLTGLQLGFAESVFRGDHRDLIEGMCRTNANRAERTFRTLESIVAESPHLHAPRPTSGFYTTVYARATRLSDLDVMGACRAWIDRYRALVVPNADFNPAETDEFGVRINLMRPVASWSHAIAHAAQHGMPL